MFNTKFFSACIPKFPITFDRYVLLEYLLWTITNNASVETNQGKGKKNMTAVRKLLQIHNWQCVGYSSLVELVSHPSLGWSSLGGLSKSIFPHLRKLDFAVFIYLVVLSVSKLEVSSRDTLEMGAFHSIFGGSRAKGR